jgi:hypothetical protein
LAARELSEQDDVESGHKKNGPVEQSDSQKGWEHVCHLMVDQASREAGLA